MIVHLVLVKPRHDLLPSERQAFAASFRRAAMEIPTVRGVRIGRRIRHGAGYESGAPDEADFMAILEFDDLAGLQAYLRHPAHGELGARFGDVVSSALVYDFELAGTLEDLM
jgi:hypothetical protein